MINTKKVQIGLSGAVLIVLICLGFTAGCGLSLFKRHADSEAAYLRALERWTAEAKIYHRENLDPVIAVRATYRSAAFRRAYVEKYARDYELTPDKAEKMLADQTDMAEKNYEFLVAVSTPTKKENSLAESPSAWRVFLEGQGFGRLEPFEIRETKHVAARLEGYYPYITHWAKVYTVRFLAPGPPAKSGKLDLVLTGVLGTARLVYKLED